MYKLYLKGNLKRSEITFKRKNYDFIVIYMYKNI